jgi:hypothetical protein
MITTLVASFRQFLRIIYKDHCSELLALLLESLTTARLMPPTKGKSQKLQPYCNCFCGKKHWCNECCYINPAIQPPEWKPKANIAAMFEQAKKNPRIAEQFCKAVEGARTVTTSQTTTTTPIAFDTQLNDNHQLYSIACLFQAFTTNHVPNPSWFNQWIMDPGSNIHIINNSKLWSWTHTQYGTADEMLLAGSQSVQISEWGTVLVTIRTPSGICKIQLTSVAFVKGFFANILSLSHCMDMKFHFDSERNFLYWATPNNVIALLDYQAGHWLIDADDGKRPNASSLMTCKRLDLCWPQWVHFGSEEHHRTSWNSMESHGSSWNPTKAHGIPQKLMKSYRSSWNSTEPHGIPQNLMESHGRF